MCLDKVKDQCAHDSLLTIKKLPPVRRLAEFLNLKSHDAPTKQNGGVPARNYVDSLNRSTKSTSPDYLRLGRIESTTANTGLA
jgi:hypothetical protein